MSPQRQLTLLIERFCSEVPLFIYFLSFFFYEEKRDAAILFILFSNKQTLIVKAHSAFTKLLPVSLFSAFAALS